MQTLQKLHQPNRFYVEQVTCNLLMLLLFERPFSETTYGTESVLKYLLIGARLLWKPANRFALPFS